MTDNVKSILGARLDRLIKERFNLNTLKAYSYKAMDEYGVNAKNEQAIRATRAMFDIWSKYMDMAENTMETVALHLPHTVSLPIAQSALRSYGKALIAISPIRDCCLYSGDRTFATEAHPHWLKVLVA
jgi:hypothetical protein